MANVIDHNSIDNSINKNANTRWAFTALSYEHREHAVNDEIMIDKETGKFYYKRPDGTIVESESSKTTFQLIQEVSNVIHQVEDEGKFEFPTSPSSIFVSATYPLSSRTTDTNIINDITPINDFEFLISKESNGFFAKVVSREIDSNYIELLTQMYNEKHSITDSNNCTIEYNVQLTMNDASTLDITKTSEVRLNNVSFVPVNKDELLTDTTYTINDIDVISVKVTKLSSDKIKEMVSDERFQTEPYSSIASSDGMIQISNVLIHSFIDKTEHLPQYNDVIIESISSTVSVQNITNSSGGMSKEDKKRFEDLISKINAMPVLYVQETEPENWKVGDVWGKIYNNASGGNVSRASNLMVKNTTFSKDELEKFLIDNSELSEKTLSTFFTMDENNSTGVLLKLLK